MRILHYQRSWAQALVGSLLTKRHNLGITKREINSSFHLVQKPLRFDIFNHVHVLGLDSFRVVVVLLYHAGYNERTVVIKLVVAGAGVIP